ncbi:MAG: hypothetical protein FD152_3046 [Xanthobacteraceae bacterium]|nr:MAG: hypothetical protein FD152_3046 [Xanthobacteraceae bacterium]
MLARVGPLFRKHLAMAACGDLQVGDSGAAKVMPVRAAAARLVAWPQGEWPGMAELPLWRRLLLARPVRRLPAGPPEPRDSVARLVAVPDGVRLPVEAPEATFALQIKTTCRATGLSRAELLGHCRRKHLTVVRAELYWIGAVHYGLSLPLIGRLMGDRDHTTILYGKRRAQAALRAAGYCDVEAMLALGAGARRQIISDHFAATMGRSIADRREGAGA